MSKKPITSGYGEDEDGNYYRWRRVAKSRVERRCDGVDYDAEDTVHVAPHTIPIGSAYTETWYPKERITVYTCKSCGELWAKCPEAS